MYTLIVDHNVIRNCNYIDDTDNNIVTFILPSKYIKEEKQLIKNLKTYHNNILFEKIIYLFNNTYTINNIPFRKCMPIKIKIYKKTAKLIMMYDNNIPLIDKEYIDRYSEIFIKNNLEL